MKNNINATGLKQYKDFREGQILTETMKGGKTRKVLVKGIYQDHEGKMYVGLQYIDRKATRRNGKITVSGKSPFWFESI